MEKTICKLPDELEYNKKRYKKYKIDFVTVKMFDDYKRKYPHGLTRGDIWYHCQVTYT